MYDRNTRTEIKVGFFVLLGLAVVAGSVLYFGRLGQGLQKFYRIEIDFPNASGLLAGADVVLGGARIGYVAEAPRVLPGMQGVAVELKIREKVDLPVMSKFVIGSSGLLGNRFVDVIVDPKADLQDIIQPGSKIAGIRETGIEDLTRDAKAVMSDIRNAVGTLNKTLDRLDSTALSQESLQDVRDTFANLKQGSSGLTEIGKAADNLSVAAADARKILSAARTGSGPLPMLLYDKQAAGDLRAVLSNIRRHGVLWYKDSYHPENAR